eukprot:contig_37534_g8833
MVGPPVGGAFALTPAVIPGQVSPAEGAAWEPLTQPLDLVPPFWASPPDERELLLGGGEHGADATASTAATTAATDVNSGMAAAVPEVFSPISYPSTGAAEHVSHGESVGLSTVEAAEQGGEEIEPAVVRAGQVERTNPLVTALTDDADKASLQSLASQAAIALLLEHDTSVVLGGTGASEWNSNPEWLMIDSNGSSWLSGVLPLASAAGVASLPDC